METGREAAPPLRVDQGAVASLGKVMERVVDRLLEQMMEKALERMTERWRQENRERVEVAVVETVNETLQKATGETRGSEEETGRKVEELMDRVQGEVAVLIDKMMQRVEERLEKETGVVGKADEPDEDSSSDDSVCAMPPPRPRGEDKEEKVEAEEEEEEEEVEEEEDILLEPPLTPNQREAFHEIFLQFTRSDVQSIDLGSLRAGLADVGVPAGELELYATLEALDTDGDGEATFEDFLRLVTSTRLFFLFYRDLPERCAGTEPQLGAVNNAVFFEILSRFLQTQMLSENATRSLVSYFYRKKKGAKLKSEKKDASRAQSLPPPLFLGQTIYSLASYVDILEPDEDYQELPPTEDQVRAFREVFELFSLDEQGCVGVGSFLDTIAEVQIHLKNPLIPDEMKCTEVNGGKDLTFEDFLQIMTDTATFGQYLAPEYEECKGVVSAPVLIFQAVNKLVSSPLLSAKTRGVVAAYYRGKFIAAAQGYAGEEEASPELVPVRPSSVPAAGKAAAAAQVGGPGKSCHGGKKAREVKARRRQLLQRKFQAALRNPAFLETFKAYSWTWSERQAKQRQEGVLCP